jgi:hypothetical protein
MNRKAQISSKSLLEERGFSSTLDRLIFSKHVKDLRGILYVSIPIFVILAAAAIASQNWTLPDSLISIGKIIDKGKILAGIVGLEIALVVWVYQTASARLGVVDLFTSEIATTCRVVTVTQTASHLNRLYDHPPSKTVRLNAPYEHSPIFDSNSKDLEVLDAQIVEQVSEFYTYMKAMCDFRRMLDDVESSVDEEWNLLVRNLTYTLFLCLRAEETRSQVL